MSATFWRLWLLGYAPDWAQDAADDAEADALVNWAIDEYARQTGRLKSNDWTPED